MLTTASCGVAQVPDYVTSANVPEDHFYPRLVDNPQRPMTTGGVGMAGAPPEPPLDHQPTRNVKTAPGNRGVDAEAADAGGVGDGAGAAEVEGAAGSQVEVVHG